jgi:light-regulated signal transduction histidine kinase (bacteriophytochrome)
MDLGNFINRCEQEKLHLSGEVQSGNALAVFDRFGTLTDVSTNFDPTLLGHDDVFDAIGDSSALANFDSISDFHQVATFEEPGVSRRYFSLVHHERTLEGAIIDAGASYILEIYGEGDEVAAPSPKSIPNFTSNEEFVELMRLATDLDRVMVYRFTDSEDGEVIAESHIQEIRSYLNHRYPASDVPMVARRLYLLNPWRTIRDRDGEASSIISIDQSPPDLTYSDVRSVSPFHIEYMKAMGTYTSLSIPIAVDGRLWGLISGHSDRYTRLTLAQLLRVKELSRRFNNKVLTEVHKRQFEILDHLGRLETRIRNDILEERSLESIMSNVSVEICRLVNSVALVVTDGEEVLSHNFDDAIEIVDTLISLENPMERPFVSEAIHKDFPDINSNYVGLTRVIFIFEETIWNLIVFRREEIEEITWGHRPTPPTNPVTPTLGVSPRASFESYVERRHGHCRSFSRTDVRALSTIARALSYG